MLIKFFHKVTIYVTVILAACVWLVFCHEYYNLCKTKFSTSMLSLMNGIHIAQ